MKVDVCYMVEDVRTNPSLWAKHHLIRQLSLNRSLRVDAYMALNRLSVRMMSHGLEAGDPYLFFGLSNPCLATSEIDVVETLVRMVRDNLFGPRMQLVVRSHPQSGEETDEGWLQPLLVLSGRRVGINFPLIRKEGLSWAVHERDLDPALHRAGRVRTVIEECGTPDGASRRVADALASCWGTQRMLLPGNADFDEYVST